MKLQEKMYDLPIRYQNLGKRNFSELLPEEKTLAIHIITSDLNNDEAEAAATEGRKPRFYNRNSSLVKEYANEHKWEWVLDDYLLDGWCLEYD